MTAVPTRFLPVFAERATAESLTTLIECPKPAHGSNLLKHFLKVMEFQNMPETPSVSM
jgi:hypothetical protein